MSLSPRLMRPIGIMPLAPTGLTATAVSGTEIDLSWTDNATNETGYYVYRSANGLTGWTRIATLAADSNSYSNTGLTAGSVWFYYVQAIRAV